MDRLHVTEAAIDAISLGVTDRNSQVEAFAETLQRKLIALSAGLRPRREDCNEGLAESGTRISGT